MRDEMSLEWETDIRGVLREYLHVVSTIEVERGTCNKEILSANSW
jgi:hypothetical protein